MQGVYYYFLSIFFLLCEHSAKGYMANTYYYITTKFEYMKRDSRLAAYGGVVLQQFEFIKICLGKTVIDIIAEIVIFWQ